MWVSFYDDMAGEWTAIINLDVYTAVRPQKLSFKTNAVKVEYGDDYHDNLADELKFNFTYRISMPINTDLLLILRMKFQNGGQMGIGEQMARLMSPVFELSKEKTSCLVLQFKALSELRVMLGYVKSDGRYEERLVHRNLKPMSSDEFLTLQRDVGGFTVEGQQFVLVFESKGQQLNGDLLVISKIQLQENQCNYFTEDVVWNGFCDLSTANGSCPLADQSENGYSWSYSPLVSSNAESTTVLRSEFDGYTIGEVSRILSPPYTSTIEEPCLLLSATFNSTNIRLSFSLLLTDNTDPLPPPEVVQTASPNGSNIQLYYIHLPVGVPVMLEINVSQFYSGSMQYSAVFLQSIEPNSCKVIQPDILSTNSINCTESSFSSCGYQLGRDWSEYHSTNDSQQYLLWGLLSTGKIPSTYKDKQNVALTPFINNEKSGLLTFSLHFTEAPATRSKTNLSLVVYKTSSLGLLTSKLTSYSGDQNETVELCLPAGRFQLAFLAYTDDYSVSSRIQLSDFQLTETDCDPPTQIIILCADENVCLSRVMSPSPQLVWKYSTGKLIQIITGNDVLIIVYDIYGELNLAGFDGRTITIYFNTIGKFILTYYFPIVTDREGCSVENDNFVSVTTRMSDGRISYDMLETPYGFDSWDYYDSTDTLQFYLHSSVARCVDLLKYTIDVQDTPQGYSLHLARNMGSDLGDSGSLRAQWTSDVLRVSAGIVCIALDLVLPSSVQVTLFQDSQNGTVWNQSVFTSGSVTGDRINGIFQVSLDRDASQIQLVVYFTESAIINNISLEFGSCHQNAPATSTNLSCDFTNLDSCGYHDLSKNESRWVATVSQAKPTGGVVGRRECVSDADGRSYVGTQNVTFMGRPCQPWNKQDPIVHPFDDISYFADSSIDVDQTGKEVLLQDVSNYCRNPSFDDTYEIWPYCISKDGLFSREYCGIPFCQDYFMKVVFGKWLDTVVLRSPPFHFSGSVCLHFQYRLSHPEIILSIQTTSLSNPSSILKLMNLSYGLQTNASDWSDANVTLNSANGQIQQVEFVAEKIGFTLEIEYATIRSIIITDSPCVHPDTNNEHQRDREKYTGDRLPSDSFRELVLNESANSNMKDLVATLGHRRDRLFYSCEWDGAACNETDIRSELTDLGLCYTFNRDESRILSADKTGATFGLRLVLNVEEYENIPVYKKNTGIKIHLHRHDDIPQVEDAGFAVSPGHQTFAPIDHQMLKNLAPPWGRCSSTDYEFFNSTDRYTTAKCQLECKTRSVFAECGCKDVYMPGPFNLCSLDVYLSCVEYWNAHWLSNCPEECLVFSYATALSTSQLSGVGLASILQNTDSIRESYWHSLEIANRVDDVELTQTILDLESVILSHRQVKDLIFRDILNPATSVTNFVLRLVGKLMEMVRNDTDSSQRFLNKFQQCISGDVSLLLQTISDQLSYMSQDILRLKKSLSMTAEQQSNLIFGLEEMKTAMLTANDFLNKFCPKNVSAQKCSSLIVNINNMINNSLILMSTQTCTTPSPTRVTTSSTTSAVNISTIDNGTSSSSSSASTPPSTTSTKSPTTKSASPPCEKRSEKDRFSLITQNLAAIQLNISEFLSCMTEYSDQLKYFQSFLNSVDQTVSTVDMAGTTRSLNTLLEEASWLQDLMVAYQNGSLTKRQLSNEFLLQSNSRLLLHINDALSGIETSVLSDLTSVINVIETRIISVYPQLIVYLYNLKTFMAHNDTTIDSFAGEMLLWRSPIPMLQDKTMIKYQLTSDQLEQVLGVGMDVASLVSQSANIVPMLVRAYNARLKQSLTNVQAELRAAQQVVIDSVNTVNQQLANFNDSTFIKDGFVRSNFLEVDIFYGELRYETIEQTTGYDMVQFLSDFGGCFGLFLGGSILSFFEILDLIIYNLIGKLSSRKISRTKKINVYPTSEVQDPLPRSRDKVHPLPEYDNPPLGAV